MLWFHHRLSFVAQAKLKFESGVMRVILVFVLRSGAPETPSVHELATLTFGGQSLCSFKHREQWAVQSRAMSIVDVVLWTEPPVHKVY